MKTMTFKEITIRFIQANKDHILYTMLSDKRQKKWQFFYANGYTLSLDEQHIINKKYCNKPCKVMLKKVERTYFLDKIKII